MTFRQWLSSFVALLGVVSYTSSANAQTPGVLYTWAAGTSDWVQNFGSGTSTLSNSGGALQIAETSGTAGTGNAYSDGFNTVRDVAPFTSGCCGGLDLTGLSSLEFDLAQNGCAPVNVQFFTQATPGSNYVALGPDQTINPGTATYTVPLTGLNADQIAYMRTVGFFVRDHAPVGNVNWNVSEIRSVGTPLTTRTIADHDGGAADFDGLICNFDCGAIGGGNGGQNNSGMAVVAGGVQWTDLGGGPGAAVTWGNGTQNAGGSFNGRPADLSNYTTAIIRMKATGIDPSVFVQYYMQTGSGFNFQAVNYGNLPADGQYHDVVIDLSSITNRSIVD